MYSRSSLPSVALVRERVVQFFTPEQLAKWDAEVAKAKTFLGLAVNE